MKYELKIGWRYLYGGKRDKVMQLLALIALGGVGVGIVTLALSHGASPVGVLTLVLSLVSVAVCLLFSVFSVFTSVSVLGVVFGVAALTVVLAVTTGFQKQFRDKVLGVNAHVIVLKSQTNFAEYRDVMKTARPASDMRSSGSSARINRQFAVTLIAITSSQVLGSIWPSGERRPRMPALPTRMSSLFQRL